MDIRFSKKKIDLPRAFPFKLYNWYWKFEEPAPGFHGDWRGPFIFKWVAKRDVAAVVNKVHARQYMIEQAKLKAEKKVKMYDPNTRVFYTVDEGT